MLASLLVAAVFGMGPLQWQIPAEWEVASPPPEPGVDVMFFPPRDGEIISVYHKPRHSGWSLAQEANDVERVEVEFDRTIRHVVSGTTCNGKLPFVDLEMTIGRESELEHVTVYGDRLYEIVYTHALNTAIAPDVREALNSICPGSN